MAQEQLGKPLGEAYQALGLPGNPEDAAEVFYLHAEDCVKVLGKQMDVAIVHLGKDEEDKKLTDEKTNSVEYLALLGGDYAYPLKLYRALREAYGEPEPVTMATLPSKSMMISSCSAFLILHSPSPWSGYTGNLSPGSLQLMSIISFKL